MQGMSERQYAARVGLSRGAIQMPRPRENPRRMPLAGSTRWLGAGADTGGRGAAESARRSSGLRTDSRVDESAELRDRVKPARS